MHYSSVLHFFSNISENIGNIVVIGGYPVIFLTVLLEGLPLIGTVVPGHIAIIAGGFLAHNGILNLWWVIMLSLAAAIIGDAFGFVLGRRYGMHLIDTFKRFLFVQDEHIEKAQSLLSKHTGKAMILGRLSPMTRALMPFLVGTGNTSHVKFWIFNCIGAVLWVIPSVMLGYGFSFGFNAIASYFGKAIVGAIIASGLIIWGYRFINRRFHIFRKYELFALIINIISLVILALMVRDAWNATSLMANFDIWINGFMNKNVGSTLIWFADAISSIGGVYVSTIIAISIASFLFFKKRWRSSAIMVMSLLSVAGMSVFLKEFFLRPRPENALQLLIDPSFPSSHAAFSAMLFFVVAYLFSPKIRHWVWRESFIVLCLIVPLVVGVSRIVLNVHWVSDVIAGWSLGLFCSTASIILVRYAGELAKGRRF